MKTFRLFACWFFGCMLAVWLARVETRSDDTGIELGLVVAGAFLLSLVEPRLPWVWGVIVPSGIIGVNLWRHTDGIWAIAGVTLAAGCAGAYIGALVRRTWISVRSRAEL